MLIASLLKIPTGKVIQDVNLNVASSRSARGTVLTVARRTSFCAKYAEHDTPGICAKGEPIIGSPFATGRCATWFLIRAI